MRWRLITRSARIFLGILSSLHALGTKANEVLQSSRAQIAKLIGAKPDEIYFTSGGTEGDNWVIKGTAMASANWPSSDYDQYRASGCDQYDETARETGI